VVQKKRNASSAEAEMKTGGLPPIAKNQQHSEDDIDGYNVASYFGPILSDIQAFIRDLDIITLEGEGQKMYCGRDKCWIPSKSHPDYGYTIGQASQASNIYNIESMTKGWEYSNMLQQKYNGNSNTTTTVLHTAAGTTNHSTSTESSPGDSSAVAQISLAEQTDHNHTDSTSNLVPCTTTPNAALWHHNSTHSSLLKSDARIRNTTFTRQLQERKDIPNDIKDDFRLHKEFLLYSRTGFQ
jgi:hypothetical protein